VRVMDRLLADDYLSISANGTVATKAEELAQSRAGTLRIKSLDLSDISGNYRYTRVYNKRYGQWKIISFEASRIHDEDARAKH